MKCPTCVTEGTTSRFWQVGETRKVQGETQHYWDEDGAFHNHTATVALSDYLCSLGHAMQHKGFTPCPTCGRQVVPGDPNWIVP